MRRTSFCSALLVGALGVTTLAEAAPSNAPSLSNVASRQIAEAELASITASLTDAERSKIEGLYIAFDPTATSLVALASCDDDGDPVIVLSDAMLGLVDVVARAKAIDDLFGTNKVQDYAVFLGMLQAEGARTLPPPAGFYQPAQTNDPRLHWREESRRHDAIDALVAHEIAHFTQGDLACPHPTATRESGDATWTAAEARAAQSLGERAYSASRVLAADATATRWLVKRRLESPLAKNETQEAHDSTEEGYIALLVVFDQIPASFYARFHQVPGTTMAGSVRTQIVRAAAAQTRGQAKTPPPAR